MKMTSSNPRQDRLHSDLEMQQERSFHGSVLVLGSGRQVYLLVGDMISKTHENLPVFTKTKEIGVY
jgi:hypothetical protein